MAVTLDHRTACVSPSVVSHLLVLARGYAAAFRQIEVEQQSNSTGEEAAALASAARKLCLLAFQVRTHQSCCHLNVDEP